MRKDREHSAVTVTALASLWSDDMSRPAILSGIAPSGRLTLGNYLGAMRGWVALQTEYDCFYVLVDLHAVTVRQDPTIFADRCFDFIAQYLACGIDPATSAIFVQSHVSEHSELAWILNCYTQVGELNRMTQFKDKAQRHAENINAGLFDYPVLMAADILLYQTTHVPVGDDQKQHLELTRDIATRFNNLYGPIFAIPEPLIPKVGARIMGLQDPRRKMSKSDANDANIIALLDSPDDIRRKLRRAVTDSGSDVLFGNDTKPGVSNLLTIFSAISDEPIASLEDRYRGSGYGKFKLDLADAIISVLHPLQMRYRDLREDVQGLQAILQKGAQRAREHGRKTLESVTRALGLIPRT